MKHFKSKRFWWPVAALPEIRVAGRFPMGRNSRGLVYKSRTHVLHHHDYHAAFQLGARRMELRPGDFTITPAGVESGYDLSSSGSHLCIHFVPLRTRRGSLSLPLHWRPGVFSRLLAERFGRVIGLFRRSARPGRTGRLASVAASTALQELLAWVAFASADQNPARADSRVEQAVNEVVSLLDNRCGESWTIPALAARAGLSQNYLAHHFKERMGLTIQRYLLHRRIDLAAHLLATTRMAVKQAGAAAGMPDPQYFNKQFRGTTGVSPSVFRQGALAAGRDSGGRSGVRRKACRLSRDGKADSNTKRR